MYTVHANVWAMCFISIIFCCYTVIVELREPPGAFVSMQWFTTVVSEGETVLLVSIDNVIFLQSSKLIVFSPCVKFDPEHSAKRLSVSYCVLYIY